jgi:hypothetical protein
MDRERFEHLLAAYGGDFRRWPAEERAAAAVVVAQDAGVAAAVADAQALDRALDQARSETGDTSALAARILAQGPRAHPWLDRRAMLALAACAVLGIVLGYGGGLLAPAEIDDAYFAAAFEAPLLIGEEG